MKRLKNVMYLYRSAMWIKKAFTVSGRCCYSGKRGSLANTDVLIFLLNFSPLTCVANYYILFLFPVVQNLHFSAEVLETKAWVALGVDLGNLVMGKVDTDMYVCPNKMKRMN